MAAISKTDIVNMALWRIGKSRIDNLTEGSTAADVANEMYDPCRREILRLYAWGWATKEQTLAELSGETSQRYDYVYAKPVDCIRALSIFTADTAAPVEFETFYNGIHTDQEEAVLVYTADVENTTLFDSTFVTALSYRLAADLVMPLMLDLALQSRMYDQLQRAMDIAKMSDAREESVNRRANRDFLEARA